MENPGKLEEEGAPLLAEGDGSPRKATYYTINGDLREADTPILDDANSVDSQIRSTTLREETIMVQDAEDFIVPSVTSRDPSKSQGQAGQKQSSIVTIFAVWNTMLGTSILTMPWAVQQAGLVCGIVIMITMAGLCLYTAYRVIHVQSLIGVDNLRAEYSDVCRFLLGGWAEWLSTLFSILSLLGAAIVYWVLMSNFLYNGALFVTEKIKGSGNLSNTSSGMTEDVVCLIKLPQNSSHPEDVGDYSPEWNLKLTPLYLVVLVMPLINWKTATFYTKLNAFGILSAIFIVCFSITKAAQWGLNAEFKVSSSDEYIPLFQWSFPDLSGTLALSYFIHNCITSIMRNQRHPENNGRDLSIAYCLVAMTYLIVGTAIYLSFPLPKLCIADNILNNFTNADNLSGGARIGLLIQMLTVFPLLVYILRVQFYTQVFNMREPTLKYIIPLNVVLIAVAASFAIYYPHVGQMIRYTGAFCGLAYGFALPCLTYMAALRLRGQLTPLVVGVHVCIIAIGFANFFSQFLMSNT